MKRIAKYIYNNYCHWKILKLLDFKHYSSAIEFGGPSYVFSSLGPVRIYKYLQNLVLVDYSNSNYWTGKNIHFLEGLKSSLIVKDAQKVNGDDMLEMKMILSSHFIEHLANPIKFLKNVFQNISENSIILTVVPDYIRTYDYNRKPTSLNHMIEDYNEELEEDDLTHLDEIIRCFNNLHLGPYSNYSRFIIETKNNKTYRKMHHHCFDKSNIVEIHEYSGFKTIGVMRIFPMHILYIGKK